jgi:hypothetical protein
MVNRGYYIMKYRFRLSKHSDIKAYSKGGDSSTHHLGTRWRWVVIFKLQPHYTRRKSPPYLMDRSMSCAQWRGEIYCSSRESNLDRHVANHFIKAVPCHILRICDSWSSPNIVRIMYNFTIGWKKQERLWKRSFSKTETRLGTWY